MSARSDTNPLRLSDTLRDLALLRASNVDLSTLLSATSFNTLDSTAGTETDAAVEQSYEFVSQARTVIKMLHRGDVETQGGRVEDLRNKLEDILKGLEGVP